MRKNESANMIDCSRVLTNAMNALPIEVMSQPITIKAYRRLWWQVDDSTSAALMMVNAMMKAEMTVKNDAA